MFDTRMDNRKFKLVKYNIFTIMAFIMLFACKSVDVA